MKPIATITECIKKVIKIWSALASSIFDLQNNLLHGSDRNHIFHAPLSIIKATHRKRKLHNNYSSIMRVNLLRQFSLVPKLINLSIFFRILRF